MSMSRSSHLGARCVSAIHVRSVTVASTCTEKTVVRVDCCSSQKKQLTVSVLAAILCQPVPKVSRKDGQKGGFGKDAWRQRK